MPGEAFLPIDWTLAFPVDSVALASSLQPAHMQEPAPLHCDACDGAIEGAPAGAGLYLWTRGEQRRVEEPPLCASCATAIGVTALTLAALEEDEG